MLIHYYVLFMLFYLFIFFKMYFQGNMVRAGERSEF